MAVWPIYPFLCKTTSWMWNHFNIVIWTLVPAFSGNLGSNNIEFTVFDIDLTLYNVTRSKRSFFFGARTINPNGEVRFSTEWWMNFTMTIPKELTTMKNEPNVDKWEPFKTKNHIALHRPGIEPGSPTWQASILPLNHRCFGYNRHQQLLCVI